MTTQILASCLFEPTALHVPCSAVRSSDKQSVRMQGGKGHMASTIWSAHASAAAAVRHQCGGEPLPTEAQKRAIASHNDNAKARRAEPFPVAMQK